MFVVVAGTLQPTTAGLVAFYSHRSAQELDNIRAYARLTERHRGSARRGRDAI